MSYNQHKRVALDPAVPLAHRLSHVRSCAVITAQRHGVHRSQVLDAVRARTGVDLEAACSDEQLQLALAYMEELRTSWPPC